MWRMRCPASAPGGGHVITNMWPARVSLLITDYQWAHWGRRLVLGFHNNTHKCALMCVCVCVWGHLCVRAWRGAILVLLASLWSGSDVRGFWTIGAALSIFISEYIQSLWNPPPPCPANPGCVRVSPNRILFLSHAAGGLTSLTLNSSIHLQESPPSAGVTSLLRLLPT